MKCESCENEKVQRVEMLGETLYLCWQCRERIVKGLIKPTDAPVQPPADEAVDLSMWSSDDRSPTANIRTVKNDKTHAYLLIDESLRKIWVCRGRGELTDCYTFDSPVGKGNLEVFNRIVAAIQARKPEPELAVGMTGPDLEAHFAKKEQARPDHSADVGKKVEPETKSFTREQIATLADFADRLAERPLLPGHSLMTICRATADAYHRDTQAILDAYRSSKKAVPDHPAAPGKPIEPITDSEIRELRKLLALAGPIPATEGYQLVAFTDKHYAAWLEIIAAHESAKVAQAPWKDKRKSVRDPGTGEAHRPQPKPIEPQGVTVTREDALKIAGILLAQGEQGLYRRVNEARARMPEGK